MLTPFESPALISQSGSYPLAWQGKVPKRVRIDRTVRAGLWRLYKRRLPVAIAGTFFDVWVDQHGNVVALFETGEVLDLPHAWNFTIVEWHEKGEMIHV